MEITIKQIGAFIFIMTTINSHNSIFRKIKKLIAGLDEKCKDFETTTVE